jgi:beta-galactosidase
MNAIIFHFGLLSSIICQGTALAQTDSPAGDTQPAVRQEILFDAGWRFHRGGAQGAEEIAFDDRAWRPLDLPHDWSIEDLPGTDSPYSPDAISQASGGFTTGGTGWYRKAFVLPAELKGRRIVIQFDGVYMNAQAWLNGASLGRHRYGYTSFSFDATGQARFGQTNVLAVKVQNEGENSRWYSGSGVYRHVWLKVLDPVHVGPWGVSLATPEVTRALVKINIQTRVANESGESSPVNVVARILDPDGSEVEVARSGQTIKAGQAFEFAQVAEVKAPRLWGLETQALYTCVSEVYRGKKLADRVETRFGIRTIRFDANQGFQINGQTVKLKGGCFHDDNGPLGARAYDRAEERKVQLLKAAGFNAIRCSHNPPSSAFLDACDRLGMLVIDEAFDMWDIEKTPFDYHLYFKDAWREDVQSMVLRDRNHPSIILWSIGNEIPDRQKPEVVATAQMLGDFIRKLEPTRPITSAVNDIKEDKDPYFRTLDVAGYNYAADGDGNKSNVYELDHARVPERIMYGSESFPLEAFGSWMAALDHPYVIGDFVWTAWDYIGEASIGWRGYYQNHDFYPWTLAYCGDMDICGWKRPQSFYRDALWKKNQISVFVKPPRPSFELNPKRESWSRWHFEDLVADWSWEGYEGKLFEVVVYSSCEEVELILNGKSLGRKPTNRRTQFVARWEVPYEAGVLRAIGHNSACDEFAALSHGNQAGVLQAMAHGGDKEANSAELRSAEAPSQIQLQADRTTLRANGEDLSYITAELLDAHGTRNPKAENSIHFEIEGPGTIIGIGNANPVSTESYAQPHRKAWRGRCLVIVKSGTHPGVVTLNAGTEGLTGGQVSIRVAP